jgi:hypothetical protein
MATRDDNGGTVKLEALVNALAAEVLVLKSQLDNGGGSDQSTEGCGMVAESSAFPSIETVMVNGLRFNKGDWTGTASDYLKIPEDGTAPSYMTQEDFDAISWTTSPETIGNGDLRLVNDCIQLSQHNGPVYVAQFYWRECQGFKMWREDWTTATVLDGWAFCDGSNGTPDLQKRMLAGYKSGDSDYGSIGAAGSLKHTHDDHSNHDDHPQHNHTCMVTPSGAGDGTTYYPFSTAIEGGSDTEAADAMTHTSHSAHSDAKHIPLIYVGIWVMRKRGFTH